MIDEKFVEGMLESALRDLRVKLEAAGCRSDAVGLSVFIASEAPAFVGQYSRFSGDLALVGMWGSEWPYQLTRDLLGEPTEIFEGQDGDGGPVH